MTELSSQIHGEFIPPLHVGGVNSASESIRQRPGSLVRTNFSFKNRGLLGAMILGPIAFGDAFASYCRRTPRLWPRWSSFNSPPHLRVDVKRLRQEFVRLSRAALIPILLEVLMKFRSNPDWPHGFRLP